MLTDITKIVEKISTFMLKLRKLRREKWKQKILTSISRFGGKPTNRETDETKKFLAIWSRNDRIWWINGNASALYLEGNTYGTCIPIIDTACPRLDEHVTKKNIRLRHSPRECLLEEMSKLALTAAWAWWWDSLAWWSLDSSLELISVLLPNLLCAVPCPSSFSSAC